MVPVSKYFSSLSQQTLRFSIIIGIVTLLFCTPISAAGNSIGTPVFNDPANMGVPDLSLSGNATPPPTEYLGLRFDALTAPNTATVGGEISGEVDVINTGTTPAYYVQMDFYLSPDKQIDEDDIWVQRKTASIHPAGTESILPYQFSVPSGLPEREYYVGVIIRSYVSGIFIVQDSILASYPTIISKNSRNPYDYLKPDLKITSISYPPGNYSIGQPLEIMYTLENTGGMSRAFSVGFYLSKDASITTSDQYLWNDEYKKGYEHMNQMTTSLYMISSSIIPGTYYLGAIVDNLHETSDSNRENNSLSSPIPITIDPPVPIDQDEFNRMVEAYIAEKSNIYRSYAGLSPLMHTVELSYLAKMHATDMANRGYFSHYTPEKIDPTERAQALGLPTEKRGEWGIIHDGIAENLVKIHEGTAIGPGYYGFVDGTDPESVATVMMLEWISSPSHHTTLIDKRLDSFGIGVVKQGTTYYGVVDFF